MLDNTKAIHVMFANGATSVLKPGWSFTKLERGPQVIRGTNEAGEETFIIRMNICEIRYADCA